MISPKVFVSYSHVSDDHKEWVKQLCIQLRGHGVDITLDQWDLEIGERLSRFMETITSHEKVLMVCSQEYVQKSNSARRGGVAKERMYIEDILNRDLDSKDVIAILKDNPDKELPRYYGDRLRINFDDEKEYKKNYWELASALLGHKLEAKPQLGRNPFLTGLDANFGRANGIAIVNEMNLTACSLDVHKNNILIFANKNNNEPCCIMLDEIGSIKSTFNNGLPLFIKRYSNSCLAHGIHYLKDKYLLNFCHASEKPTWILSTLTIDINGTVIDTSLDKSYHCIVEEGKLSGIPSYEDEIRIVLKGLDNSLDESKIITLNVRDLPQIRRAFCTVKGDKVYLFGSGDWSMILYRFNMDGTIDTSFKNDAGLNTYTISACFLNAYGIAFQDDEKILIVGDGNESNILRLNRDGTIDKSFGQDGMLEFRATYRSSGRHVFCHHDKILMAGTSNNGNSLNELFLARFNMDGTPDYTFNGEENYFAVDIKGLNEFKDMVITEDNKAYILCQSDNDAGKFSKMAVVKIHL